MFSISFIMLIAAFILFGIAGFNVSSCINLIGSWSLSEVVSRAVLHG